MPSGHRLTHRITQRLVRTSDPRLAQAAGVGAVLSVLGLAMGVWLDRPALLGVAGLLLVGAMMALIALDEQLRAPILVDQPTGGAAPARLLGTAEAEPVILGALPVTPRGPAPVLAAGTVIRNRIYPNALAQLLAADDMPLPDGHAWPDLSKVRGSLAVRAQMAVRFPCNGSVAAASPDAPVYVSYAHHADVATGLYVASLGWRATPVVAFLDASVCPGLSDDERFRLDDAMAAAWHSTFSQTCTPPPVLELLVALGREPGGPGGARILEWLEGARMAMRGGSGLDAILLPWASWRTQLALEARRGGWSESQRNTAEVLCDWLLLQRASAEDLAAADRDRAPSETRGDALSRRDGTGPFVLEQALAVILDSAAVSRLVPDAAAVAALALHDANETAVASAA